MFIIGEIGSNFSSLEDVLHSIEVAGACGANAAKFQLFSDRDMFGTGSETTKLKVEWFPLMKETADKAGVELMVTAFSVDGLRAIDPFVSRHKIASSDMDYLELLDVARGTGKPLIVSTGGHTWAEIEFVSSYLGKHDVTLLYCESAYPCHFVDLKKALPLRQLRSRVGLSDHSLEVYSTASLCKILGLDVVEKHVNFCGFDGPDSGHSLDADDFTEYVRALTMSVRDTELLSGGEADMVLRHNRRLVAIQDIPKDSTLVYNVNYGCYRSTYDDVNGLPARDAKSVNGTIAAIHIAAGEPIGRDLLHGEAVFIADVINIRPS